MDRLHRAPVWLTVATMATACLTEQAAPDAGIDAPFIVVLPVDAPPRVIDAPIRDAPPPVEGPIYDAFPCVRPTLQRKAATLAGCAAPGAVDGDRNVARFDNPVNVVLGPDGDVYVADHGNHRIRAVTPSGTTRTVIDHGGFRRPWGMAFATDGTFFVQTDENDRGELDDSTGTIWIVDRSARMATVVRRNEGRPRGMVALPDGRVALADPAHHVVRILGRVATDGGPAVYSISGLAGGNNQAGYVNATGGAARFNGPRGLAVLPDESILVADEHNHRIRRVQLNGVVTTFAGAGGEGAEDGPVGDARFDAPFDVAASMDGVVFVSDGDNHLIRRIADDMVSTVAGTGVGGYEDSDELRDAAFFGMEGIDVAPDGMTLWIADGSRGELLPYHRVRRVSFP